MRKIRLDPDALDVLSFAVAHDAEPHAGTVQGHQHTVLTINNGSCDRPCRPVTYQTDCSPC